jgi:hypothetical protein
MTSDDDMDLLDDDEAPLITDGSPLSTSIDINMVFTLSAEFRGIEEEVAQMCLGTKEVVFEMPEESSQHLKTLYEASRSPPHSSSSRCKVTVVLFLAVIGFTPTTAFLLLCINS